MIYIYTFIYTYTFYIGLNIFTNKILPRCYALVLLFLAITEVEDTVYSLILVLKLSTFIVMVTGMVNK